MFKFKKRKEQTVNSYGQTVESVHLFRKTIFPRYYSGMKYYPESIFKKIMVGGEKNPVRTYFVIENILGFNIRIKRENDNNKYYIETFSHMLWGKRLYRSLKKVCQYLYKKVRWVLFILMRPVEIYWCPYKNCDGKRNFVISFFRFVKLDILAPEFNKRKRYRVNLVRIGFGCQKHTILFKWDRYDCVLVYGDTLDIASHKFIKIFVKNYTFEKHQNIIMRINGRKKNELRRTP